MPAPASPSRGPLPDAAPSPASMVDVLARACAPLAPWMNRWHERQEVDRISRELLRLHGDAHAAWPELHGRELYALILELWQPDAAASPEDQLDRAAESFATWPVERALTLRDVVHYVAACQLLGEQAGPGWTQGRLGPLVGARIPSDL